MIERRTGRDQGAHDLGVAEMHGRDQRRPVVWAGDVFWIAGSGQRQVEHRDVVVHRRDGHDVVALCIERVRIGATFEERLGSWVMAEMRRDMQRRAAMRIPHVRLPARRNQPLDFAGIAFHGGGMQTGVDAQLRWPRWDLRERGKGACKNDHESENKVHAKKSRLVRPGQYGSLGVVSGVGITPR